MPIMLLDIIICHIVLSNICYIIYNICYIVLYDVIL